MIASHAWIGYLAASLCAEIVLPFAPIATGIVDALVLVAALSHFGWAQRSPLAIGDPPTRLLPAVALLPLLRLLSLTMPVPEFPTFIWLALAGAPLVLAIIVAARLTSMDILEVGLARISRSWQSGALVLMGVPAGLALAWLQEPSFSSTDTPAGAFAIALVAVGFAAIPEELIFRGLLQPLMSQTVGRSAVVIAALASGLTYAGSRSPGVMALMFGVGILYGWEVWRTNSIWAPIIGHSLLLVVGIFVAPALLTI